MNNSLNSIIPLMHAKAAINNVDDFHKHINQIFHDHEARYYDTIHEEMWMSLPVQYQLITNDIYDVIENKPRIKLLDIGCGTGLATEMLLATAVGKHVSDIYLLDTSAEMLKKAASRSKNWTKKIKLVQGDITQLNEKFDLIIISSVLHHIPDLHKFLNDIDKLQLPGGILITIHDPAEEAVKSDSYKKRCEEYNEYQRKNLQIVKKPLYKRAVSKLLRMLKPQNYIESINNELLKKNIIKVPLTAPELWSVTDIHVEALPYSASNGISKKLLLETLSNYDLLSYRTYGFFGTLHNNLSPEYQATEHQLILNKDKFGRNFNSAWIKTS